MTPKISPEQRKALDERNGQPVYCVDVERQETFVLASAADERVRQLFGEANGDGEWTEQKDARRCELIDKDIARTITEAERTELAGLERLANEYYDAIAPPPLDGARRLHQELLNKRAND